LAWRQRRELGRVRPVGRHVGQGCGACQRSLVMYGAGTWRGRTACPRAAPGRAPTGWVWPPAILNLTVPPGLTGDRGRLLLVGGGAVHLLAALGLAESGAAEEQEASDTDVKQWQAQLAYRAWRVEG